MRRMVGPITLVAVVLASASCSNQHASDIVGTECLPESLPSNAEGVPGYSSSETYLQTSEACGHHPCIVHRLFNGTSDLPADPSNLCDDKDPKPGCVEASAVAESVHCTCRCAGPDDKGDYCTCPADFKCREVLTTGPKSMQGSYCVKRETPH